MSFNDSIKLIGIQHLFLVIEMFSTWFYDSKVLIVLIIQLDFVDEILLSPLRKEKKIITIIGCLQIFCDVKLD